METPLDNETTPARLKWTKLVVRTLAGHGTAYILGESIDALVGAPETRLQKILNVSGRIAIGMYVTDKVKQHTEVVVDEYIRAYDESKIAIAEMKAEIQAQQNVQGLQGL